MRKPKFNPKLKKRIIHFLVNYITNHWLINPSIMIDIVLNSQKKS
jgi:hypothetical protein